MDQQQLTNLDPKLREAYERIMSAQQGQAPAATPPAQPVPVQAPVQSAPAPQNSVPPPTVATISPYGADPLDAMAHAVTRFAPTSQTTVPAQSPEAPAIPQEVPAAPAAPSQVPSAQPVQETYTPSAAQVNQSIAGEQIHAYVAQEVAGAKKSIQIIQIMYVTLGIVFFVIYSLVWMKVFNIASPF